MQRAAKEDWAKRVLTDMRARQILIEGGIVHAYLLTVFYRLGKNKGQNCQCERNKY